MMETKQAYGHFIQHFFNVHKGPSTNRNEESGKIYQNRGIELK